MSKITGIKPAQDITRVWYQAHTDVIAVWNVNADGMISVESRYPWDDGIWVDVGLDETVLSPNWVYLGEFY